MGATTEIRMKVPLRFLADRYEAAQRVRIATGERIRAILQGRDAQEVWGAPGQKEPVEAEEPVVEAVVEEDEIEGELKAILRGESDGPLPILGRTYRRHHEEEREMYEEMAVALEGHPAWPWLTQVKGIGPTLACKLLARLDVRLAKTPSSFWLYCGLATVPGALYTCSTCGLERTWPVGYEVKGGHQALGTKRVCKGNLEFVREGEDVRAALPRAGAGQKRCYDAYAKKVMYLVGCQFEKLGRRAAYPRFYREALGRLERERPRWNAGRQRFTAMRIVEKLFLSHLWEVWRKAERLSVVEHYASAYLAHGTRIAPEEMVG